MPRLDDAQVNAVAKCCFHIYDTLPKTGKPIENEWTVLSCVVKCDDTNVPEVVSLGTGSKCIGASKMSPAGDVLNDSHAEVVARRGFLLYLYDQASDLTSSIFINNNGQLKLKNNIEFIFYSSQLPCGDASIIPKTDDEEHYGDLLQLKRAATDDLCKKQSKIGKSEFDIHRTGAKCLPESEQDLRAKGPGYHLLGQVRTKPGRGDRTLSVSCSDKIAKWIHVGIQGSLLNMLVEPIYIKHFVFGAGVPYSKEALRRAFFSRNLKSGVREINVTEIYQSTSSFCHIRTENRIRPAPGSIVWAKTKTESMDVAIQGRKLRQTKKKTISAANSLCISKYKLYEKFQHLLTKNNGFKLEIDNKGLIENIPYNEMKKKSERYLENWNKVKEQFFKTWTIKPDIFNFCVIRV